jgi:hypothetical protein
MFGRGLFRSDRGMSRRRIEEASATEERADWGWEAEKGDEAWIIRRAVGHTISNQTKRSKHGRTFPPSSDYDPSPALPRPASSGVLDIAASMRAPRRAQKRKETLTLARDHQPRWLCRFVTWTILKPSPEPGGPCAGPRYAKSYTY